MSLAAGFTLYGAEEMLRMLGQLAQASRGPFLLDVATTAGVVVMRAAKDELAQYSVSGDLENSVCIGGLIPPEQPTRGTDIQGPDVTGDSATVYVGSNHPAARRRELGFVGTDARGHRVNDPGRPYLRPAFDQHQTDAMVAAASEVRELFVQHGGHP